MNDSQRIPERDHYERPNQKWACGNLKEGCPCHFGPDSHGRCLTTAECTPVQRGDQWLCTRSAVVGGPCELGPLPDGQCCRPVAPCVPIRTMQSRRRVFVTACTLLTLGFLMIGITGPRRNQFLSSGQLSSSHARLADAQNCDLCHSSAHQGAGSWIGRILQIGGGRNEIGTVQSDKCLTCHAELFNDPWQHVPHNVDPQQLATRTASYDSRVFRFRELFGGSIHDQASLNCSTCHREHHGSDHDLEFITNRQCQSCHAETFASLATGHPDFGDWPYRKPSKIAFNHLSHESLHFPNQAETFDCARCHVDDATQTVKQLAGFDQACASCHNPSIKESFANGIPLLSLPVIDRTVLHELSREIPEWPESADGIFDGTIPPLMQLLLASDELAAKAMEALPPSLDFSLIDEDDPKQLHAAADLAEAIRRLMAALDAHGTEEIKRRFAEALHLEIDDAEISVITNRTPSLLLSAVAQAWFPNTDQSQVSLDLEQRYPTWDNRNSRLVQERSRRDSNQSESRSTQTPLQRVSFGRQDDRELLAENPLREWLESQLQSEQQALQQADAPEVIATDPPIPADTEPESSGEGENDQETLSPPPVIERIVTREVVKLMPSGDWVYDEFSMKLNYAPIGHADAMLQELIELIGRTPLERRSPVVQRVAERLTEEMAPGRCASCHTISERELSIGVSSDETTKFHDWLVNWQGGTRRAEERGFTRFVHRPHLNQTETQDCSMCHALDRGYVLEGSDREINPYHFRSEFLPLRKGTCATCHHSEGASDRCTTCHNYHVQSHNAGSTW